MGKGNFNQRLNSQFPLAYLGNNSYQPSEFYEEERAPLVTDARNYRLGAWWLNTVNENLYYLGGFKEAGVVGDASWNLVSGGTGAMISLTGNTPPAVTPLAGNINVITDNANIIFNGATANTLTLDFALTTNMLLGADGAITSGIDNVALGSTSLAAISSGSGNTAAGSGSLTLNATGDSNAAYGASALSMVDGSSLNSAFGASALELQTGGLGQNVAVGTQSLGFLLTGTENIALGAFAGSNYTGAENQNIAVGALGTTGESSVIRIGTSGDHTTAFMQGIYGVAPVGPPEYVVIDANGQLGTDGSAGSIFLNVTNISNIDSPYTVLLTDSLISVGTSVAVVTVLLPDAPASGQVFYVKDRQGFAATFPITVTTVGGAVLIDGATTYVLNTAYQSNTFVFNGITGAYEII